MVDDGGVEGPDVAPVVVDSDVVEGWRMVVPEWST